MLAASIRDAQASLLYGSPFPPKARSVASRVPCSRALSLVDVRHVRRSVAKALAKEMREVYDSLAPTGPYQKNPEEVSFVPRLALDWPPLAHVQNVVTREHLGYLHTRPGIAPKS